ncbi:helix-turn-helix domain-containing protein [Denitratisoma sp. DHT3]|uniref:helix-turn-helix domain-containing protein n=1 Tax=Denitratisoma sp. DHT3 TaxID=1981880 RepID=UPI0039657430
MCPARSYLESSRLLVETIAERLGFNEPTCFSRAFRRWTGMSPGATGHPRAGYFLVLGVGAAAASSGRRCLHSW